MSASHVSYKMPRARTISEFTVYPFTKDDNSIKLQSDNHCIIVYHVGPLAGYMLVSKRFNQYPIFAACMPAHGGKCIPTPDAITQQVTEIRKAPTGHTVLLVGWYMYTVNGFTFNYLGELEGEPEGYTMDDLNDTYQHLISDREYISASRIQHLINIF